MSRGKQQGGTLPGTVGLILRKAPWLTCGAAGAGELPKRKLGRVHPAEAAPSRSNTGGCEKARGKEAGERGTSAGWWTRSKEREGEREGGEREREVSGRLQQGGIESHSASSEPGIGTRPSAEKALRPSVEQGR